MLANGAPQSVAFDAAPAGPLVISDCCPSCGSSEVAPLFSKNGHDVQRCGRCELGFLPALPSTAALESLYSAAYFTAGGFEGYPDYLGDEWVHRRQARYYLRDLARAGIARGAVLDVGCAAGFFLDEARRDGWQVMGCDVSQFAVNHARACLGLDVVHGNFAETRFPAASVDLVTFWSVIAHVPNPRAVERRLAELVRPGGHVAIETSNYRAILPRLLGSRWHLCSPPSVMYYYTQRALETLFAASRWRLVTFRPAVKRLTVKHALSRLSHRATSSVATRAFTSLERIVPGMLTVPYALGDIAFAVFQRRSA